MNNKFYNLLHGYVNSLIQNYQLIAQINASSPILKLISKECDEKTGETFFIVQISGKNIFPRVSAGELFKNREVFLNFNIQDQEEISRALPQKKQEISKHIIARTFDKNKKQFTFTVALANSDKKACLSAIEILQEYKNLQGFSHEDAFLIGLEANKYE